MDFLRNLNQLKKTLWSHLATLRDRCFANQSGKCGLSVNTVFVTGLATLIHVPHVGVLNTISPEVRLCCLCLEVHKSSRIV